MGCSPVNNKNLNLRTYILDIKDSPIARQSICKRNRKMVIGEENMVLSNNIKIIVEENMDQILKILVIAACHRIYGLVGIRHRVQERIQRALHDFDKRIFDREIPRAAQNRVLNDMRDSC